MGLIILSYVLMLGGGFLVKQAIKNNDIVDAFLASAIIGAAIAISIVGHISHY